MADLLIELVSEEIPARMQVGAGRDLARLLVQPLGGLSGSADRAARPRPLAAVGPPPSGELEERLQRATAYVHDAMQVEPRSAARTPDEPTRASTCC